MVERNGQASMERTEIPDEDQQSLDNDWQDTEEETQASDERRQPWDLSETGEDLEALQSLFDDLGVEQARRDAWFAQKAQAVPAQADEAQYDQPAFDDDSLRSLKAAMEGLAWCSNCHIISRMADWWTQDQCPKCHVPVFALFAWADLRRINSDLPEAPPVGQPFQMGDV